MTNKVSIATKPLVYSTFRFINNKVWYALAEYVDNSIQSYIDNKAILSKINPNGRLRVEISIQDDLIIVTDNAGGIAEGNFQRAFELANIPLDASGLNEFGMGMKVSSIWLSNVWKVETTALNENMKKTVVFDVNDVTAHQKLDLDVKIEECPIGDHYTTITLSSLSQNKPRPRQIGHIKKHLASIYTKFIRDKELELVVNGELLVYEPLNILNAPYYRTPEGKKVNWYKEINFIAPKYKDGKEVGKYVAKGFIALLETMSTSDNNGFLLFRRGRVIGSSGENKYRPLSLCGQEGSPRYKRIFGELEIEGFDVSFTKSSFQEDEDFEAFIQVLRDDIAKDKSFDIFGQGQNYVKPKSQTAKAKIGNKLVKKIAEQIKKPINVVIPKEDPKEGSKEVNPKEEIPKEDVTLQKPENSESITTEVGINGKKFILKIECYNGETSQNLYTFNMHGNECVARINMRNKFFDSNLTEEDIMESVSYFIKTLVATELSFVSDSDSTGMLFRNRFNSFFGMI